jgi:magnesium chelatase family protein
VTLATLASRGQLGLTAYPVTVEVQLSRGLPGFTITGLPDAAVRESRERVRAVLHGNGLSWPKSRITAHLGPADIPKDGGRFDLPIALGIVQAETKRRWNTSRLEFIGELALSGELRPVTGALPALLAAHADGHALVLPEGNSTEAGLVADAVAYRASHLSEVIAHLDGEARLGTVAPTTIADADFTGTELGDVRGQAIAKRALTIAAAGGHNLLMIGPPGSGKSMLAERLAGLLPPLAPSDLLCVASIASVAGLGELIGRSARAPYRAPHHTASAAALVGGGSQPRPGEISLAHRGVLFLDELPEFSRNALEALREPLETGIVRIARVHRTISFPAAFQLVAAMNPCPCGYLGDGTDRCSCAQTRISAYRARLSGPLLDRIDLHIDVPRVAFSALVEPPMPGESARVRARVADARRAQIARAGVLNARLADDALRATVEPDDAGRALLARAAEQWQLSLRAVTRVLKVARTIADLAGEQDLAAAHIAEALQLRCLDRPA